MKIYQDGSYLANNPTWHTEDSPWKASQIHKIMEANNVRPKTVCEIGCGAGEILNSLHAAMKGVEFVGYEISSQAYEIALQRRKEHLDFKLADLLQEDNREHYNVLLVIDVFEHIEDYFTFLRKCREKADYKIFHIPLELSVQTVLRMTPLLNGRKKVGHLHYFSKETALETLKDAGYEIISYFYTDAPFAVPKSIKGRMLNLPRKFLSLFSRDLAVRILGGYSLMVLTR